jgi:hypothetical protein
LSTPKAKPAQGRSFFIAELYRAAFMLEISDGAHRVLSGIIANTNMLAGDADFQTTYVGQDWIALHAKKHQSNVRKFIKELVVAGILSVDRRGHNITNKMRVNTNAILELAKMRHDVAAKELSELRSAKAEHPEGVHGAHDVKNDAPSGSVDRAKSSAPDQAISLSPDRAESLTDLVSLNLVSNDHSELTVATPSASQPSGATNRVGGSRLESSTGKAATTITPPKPQSPRGFDDDTIALWEAMEITILSRLEALRLDGQTTSERINTIHQSLMSRRYTIGSELLTAYEQGLTEAHEAQLASEWIMKVALAPTSDPRRYVTTLRAFIKGKADMFTASAGSRATKHRRASAS